MSPDWNKRSDMEPTDELGRDVELGFALELLDPGYADPSYWMRFRSRVLRMARPELARRHLMRDPTLPDVVMSWARAVVPAAVLAAALAGVLLLHEYAASPTEPATVGVEELLAAGLQGSTIPAELERTQVAFASESF